MTAATLRNHTCKDLAQMAKKRGVPGWHSMRKDQLVRALVKLAKQPPKNGRSRSTGGNGNGSRASRNGSNGKSGSARNATRSQKKKAAAKKKSNPRIQTKIRRLQQKLATAKNISTTDGDSEAKDRLVVMVRDAFWLHVYWELSRRSVSRVQASMGQRWHTATPMLRLFKVSGHEKGAASETMLRTIEIHGGVNNWYVDVNDPPESYRIDIGYAADDGEFHRIARSNIVTTPPASARDSLDENWHDVAENFDKIYAMSGGYTPEGTTSELRELLEERLRRPMGAPIVTRYGAGANCDRESDFHFDADAEMIVFGTTTPNAHVMLSGEPVQVRPDGTFTIRMNMPDRRQVIPLVANSNDGVEQRTIVLAVERNTKRMETVVRDAAD